MRRTAPLFRLDPGWLFTLAGLAVMVVSALLPAERDLHELRQQMAALEVREAWNEQRLAAYDRFMRDLSERDPALIRRLAASQLNLMPEGEQPLLMATSIEHTVSDWIEATVPEPTFTPVPPPDTLLTRLAAGSRRLWMMGGGAMVVFLGLVMGFGVSPRPALPADPEVEAFARAATEAVEEAPSADEAGAADTDEVPSSEGGAVDVEPESGLLAACEDECADLPVETLDVEHPAATAEPVEHESFEWPEAVAPFEPASAESAATVDGSIAAAWEAETVDSEGASPGTYPAEEPDWMRDHGSD